MEAIEARCKLPFLWQLPQSRGAATAERERKRVQRHSFFFFDECRGTADDGTYCVERALPVVGDVGLAFRRFLEDPFVTFIRGHLSHQPACRRARRVQTKSDHGLSTSFMINSCNACPKSSVQTTAKRDQKRPRHTQNTQRATD
jgi:hypothetical protein